MGFTQPTPLEVNYMYTLKRIPSEGVGFYYLSAWSSGKLNLIENYPSNDGHWKKGFFWVQQSGVPIRAFRKAGGELTLLYESCL